MRDRYRRRGASAPSYPSWLRREFRERLHTNWESLADELGMEGPERRDIRDNARDKGAAIWDYLEARGRLSELPDALRRVRRPDLATLFDTASAQADHTPAQGRPLDDDPPSQGVPSTISGPRKVHPRNVVRTWTKIAAAVACAAAVAGAAAILVEWPGGDDPVGRHASCPAASPRLYGIAVDNPCEGSEIPACVSVSGRSSLPPGKTLVTAVQNVDGSPTIYFQPVQNWAEPHNLGTWTAQRYFGNVANGMGQHYKLTVLAVDVATVRGLITAAGDELWPGDKLIEGEVAAVVGVRRSRTAGPATC
jgi:hypothetical protein